MSRAWCHNRWYRVLCARVSLIKWEIMTTSALMTTTPNSRHLDTEVKRVGPRAKGSSYFTIKRNNIRLSSMMAFLEKIWMIMFMRYSILIWMSFWHMMTFKVTIFFFADRLRMGHILMWLRVITEHPWLSLTMNLKWTRRFRKSWNHKRNTNSGKKKNQWKTVISTMMKVYINRTHVLGLPGGQASLWKIMISGSKIMLWRPCCQISLRCNLMSRLFL